VEGVKLILPIWHKINAEQIRAYSPILADRLAATSDKGLDYVIEQLMQAVRKGGRPTSGIRKTGGVARFDPASNTDPGVDIDALVKYASEFHRRRIEQIMTKPPIGILDGGALILHVVPIAAINEKPNAAFDEIARNPHIFPPMGTTYARDMRISYDGLLTGSNAEGLIKPQRSYVHVFRFGSVEAVETSLARGQEHIYLYLPQLQATVIKYAYLYARSLNRFDIQPPYAVVVSLAKVHGMTLLQDFIGTALPFDLPGPDLDRDLFHFGVAIFETTPSDYNEGAKRLKPILSHLANAAGLHSSPYFDENGNYTLIDKL
jgi:hypothetical protein